MEAHYFKQNILSHNYLITLKEGKQFEIQRKLDDNKLSQ